MTTVTGTTTRSGLPVGRPLTVDDLDAWLGADDRPDDGRRYELIDGLLIAAPAPGWSHQEVAGTLYTVLRAACPPGLRVLISPFAVRLAGDTELQPDVLVARFADLTPKLLPVAPLLAVEVLSPSTRLVDRTLKAAAYARHGVPAYWLVDPDPQRPVLTVQELRGGEYAEMARATATERLAVTAPFPVTLAPADLVVGLHPDPE